MLKNKTCTVLLGLLVLFSCRTEKKPKDDLDEKETLMEAAVDRPKKSKGQEVLEKCLDAHGGFDQWQAFEGLEYELNDNGKLVYQLTHLKDRRAYLKSKKYEVGFDGNVAWAVPDASQVSGGSAAFYYNLDFYFIGMPFLLKDPGVNATYAGRKTIDETDYEALKITFGQGVGFTPEDVYFLYIDPKTYVLRILTYSISYFDKAKAQINSAKVYSDYKIVQGILMPHKMENFEWEHGTMGKSKNHLRLFKDIRFLEEIPDESLFNFPEGAIIEEL